MTKTATEMIQYMKDMDNGERIELLIYLFDNHFNHRPTKGDMSVETKHYIEDYIDRDLTEDETLIMKLAYDTGYSKGCFNGRDQVIKGWNLED